MPSARRSHRTRRLTWLLAPGAALVVLAVAACSPALDWRQVRSDGAQVQALFPCKPKTVAREVALVGAKVRMVLAACEAGGHTWALAHADMTDPARVGPALAELRAKARGKLQGPAGTAAPRPLAVPGATPNEAAARERLQGRLPDGREVIQHLAVFARGTVVIQAVALGAGLPDDAADTFIDSLRGLP
jgi:hypothetical protein